MKLDELLKTHLDKPLTQEVVNAIMQEMDGVKAKAIASSETKIKELSEKIANFEKEGKESKKNSALEKAGINIDEFKEFKSYDEFLALEEDKEGDFLKALKEKKPTLFKEIKEEEVGTKEEENFFGDENHKEKEDKKAFEESKILSSAFEDIK